MYLKQEMAPLGHKAFDRRFNDSITSHVIVSDGWLELKATVCLQSVECFEFSALLD